MVILIFFSRYPLENTNQESSQLTNQVLFMELLHSLHMYYLLAAS